jgi:hypothetical protein
MEGERYDPSFATDFATSFAKATEVEESFVGQRKLRRVRGAMVVVNEKLIRREGRRP